MRQISTASFFIPLMLFPILAIAQADVSTTAEQSPGITPDSPFYILDVAIDNIRMLLALDPESKATTGLQIAEERLLEVRAMILENNLQAASKAKIEHNGVLLKVQDGVAKLKLDDNIQELGVELKIERELNKHKERIEIISDEIEIEIKSDVAIDKVFVEGILSSISLDAKEVEVKIEVKKGETKVKIKTETGKTDDEVDDIEDIHEDLLHLEEKLHENKGNLNFNEIKETQALIDQAREKILNNDFDASEGLAEQAESSIEDKSEGHGVHVEIDRGGHDSGESSSSGEGHAESGTTEGVTTGVITVAHSVGGHGGGGGGH